MVEKRPLNILFISESGIGMLIEHELHDDHNPKDRVVAAVDLQTCEYLLLNGEFDLLITGGRIQGHGDAGLELTRFAKENCPEIKVIIMSSWTDEEEALAASADRHWVGSSSISELIEIIKELFPE